MTRRIRLKRKKNLAHIKKSNLIIVLVIFIIIATIFVFKFINKRVTPVLMEYAETQASRLASIVINEAVNDKIAKDYLIEDLFIITTDEDGKITNMELNPIRTSAMLSNVNHNVQEYLQKVENGDWEDVPISNGMLSEYNPKKAKKGIIYEIPSGMVFGNTILYNLGPKIPVRIALLGDISSTMETRVNNYGINNAVIEVAIKVTLTEQVILPYTSKKIVVNTEVPIAIKLVQGEVPNYYFNSNGGKDSVIHFPIE